MSAADRAAVEDWVATYRRAWESDDPGDIAALFTEDATYSPSPFSESWRGRDAIVEEWIERGDSTALPAFEHEVIAAEGAVGVIKGLTTYHATDKTPETVYGNLWIVSLAPGGRATSFAEWWMQRPEKKA
jgi:uncharacterized protein (TIGR02246 family)